MCRVHDSRRDAVQATTSSTRSFDAAIIDSETVPSIPSRPMTAETDMRSATLWDAVRVPLRGDPPREKKSNEPSSGPDPEASGSGPFACARTVSVHPLEGERGCGPVGHRVNVPRGHVSDKPYEIRQFYIDELGLSGQPLLVYALIAASDLKPLGNREIARRTGLSRRNVTRVLHELQAAGLIRLERREAGPKAPAIWRAIGRMSDDEWEGRTDD